MAALSSEMAFTYGKAPITVAWGELAASLRARSQARKAHQLAGMLPEPPPLEPAALCPISPSPRNFTVCRRLANTSKEQLADGPDGSTTPH